ncbi:hypothetical protein E2C01_035824 [Portunus trituberculatus]|uniref:Uncharacterized protein n=1 Tax=Portunus trituberculatus TaxID=210409 RepID=A0A5B7FAR9_PORTR|nr:hypothetical protein [Portunus trituberculatus]
MRQYTSKSSPGKAQCLSLHPSPFPLLASSFRVSVSEAFFCIVVFVVLNRTMTDYRWRGVAVEELRISGQGSIPRRSWSGRLKQRLYFAMYLLIGITLRQCSNPS